MSVTDTPGGSGTETPTDTPQYLGLKAAAKYAGVAVSTLQRRRDELELYGSTKDESGWSIPLTALVSMGLIDASHGTQESPLIEGVSVTDTPGGSSTETPSMASLYALKQELAEARQEAAVARAECDAERRRADEHLERARDAERRLDSMITNQTALTLTISEQHKALVAPVNENLTEQVPSEPSPPTASASEPSGDQTSQPLTSEVLGGRVRRWFKK